MEARTTYGRYTGWNNLREPHGNRDGFALHRRTVGEGTDGRSGVWLESSLSREEIRDQSERWGGRLKERLPISLTGNDRADNSQAWENRRHFVPMQVLGTIPVTTTTRLTSKNPIGGCVAVPGTHMSFVLFCLAARRGD